MKSNSKKIINTVIPVIGAFIWLMPVSRQKMKLDEGLNNRMYLVLFVFLFIVLLIDSLKKKKVSKKEVEEAGISIGLVSLFSLLTYLSGVESTFGLRQFGFFCIISCLLAHSFTYIEANACWRITFYITSTIIGITGVLMMLGNDQVWDFFSTYYVNHYFYIYASFQALRKPVTFFAANATTVPIYFLIYMLWELCESKRHKIISLIYKIVFLILILGCANNGAILAVGLISLYYLFCKLGKLSLKVFLRKLLVFALLIIGLILGLNYLQTILFSTGNGLLGRYSSSGAGNVIVDIKYLLSFNLPTGCFYSHSLYYTDSGFIVYSLMGSVLLPIILYKMVYEKYKKSCNRRSIALFLFVSFALFELAYPLLLAQRYAPVMLFSFFYLEKYEC